jgi:hypothetical protein
VGVCREVAFSSFFFFQVCINQVCAAVNGWAYHGPLNTHVSINNMKNKKLKKQYSELLELIREVIINWDPYSLIHEGAPTDEFNNEIEKIAIRIKEINNKEDAINIVSEIFKESFEPEYFSLKTCSSVGNELFNKLKENEFIKQ